MGCNNGEDWWGSTPQGLPQERRGEVTETHGEVTAVGGGVIAGWILCVPSRIWDKLCTRSVVTVRGLP
ncbi:hypothetical protein Bca4012_020469 [Brassica carinata]|uniref:Uncharacterized protein n=1 Tax=Brassica carinata TaxID=52824 RepID=A0A8X7WGV8_BRACI|nr:hypothetical protein Bca52824_001181 [Brassica carinata]